MTKSQERSDWTHRAFEYAEEMGESMDGISAVVMTNRIDEGPWKAEMANGWVGIFDGNGANILYGPNAYTNAVAAAAAPDLVSAITAALRDIREMPVETEELLHQALAKAIGLPPAPRAPGHLG